MFFVTAISSHTLHFEAMYTNRVLAFVTIIKKTKQKKKKKKKKKKNGGSLRKRRQKVQQSVAVFQIISRTSYSVFFLLSSPSSLCFFCFCFCGLLVKYFCLLTMFFVNKKCQQQQQNFATSEIMLMHAQCQTDRDHHILGTLLKFLNPIHILEFQSLLPEGKKIPFRNNFIFAESAGKINLLSFCNMNQKNQQQIDSNSSTQDSRISQHTENTKCSSNQNPANYNLVNLGR